MVPYESTENGSVIFVVGVYPCLSYFIIGYLTEIRNYIVGGYICSKLKNYELVNASYITNTLG